MTYDTDKDNPDNRPCADPVAVIGLGGSLFDTFMVVPEFPGEDTKMKAKATLSQCGGPAATALTAVGKLGLPCAFFGAMGDDPAGQAMLADFAAYGVRTDGIQIRAGCQSASSMILVNEARATRTIVWSGGTAAPIRPDELNMQLMEQSRVLHLDGLNQEAALFAARTFHAAGKIVSLDGGSFHPASRICCRCRLAGVRGRICLAPDRCRQRRRCRLPGLSPVRPPGGCGDPGQSRRRLDRRRQDRPPLPAVSRGRR
jgi:hypothetical protein